MKHLAIVLAALLFLLLSSCTVNRTETTDMSGNGSIVIEPEENGVLPGSESASVPEQDPADPNRQYDIHLSKAFKELCREAVIAADGHLNGTSGGEDTQEKLFEISEKMVIEHENLQEGDSKNAGTAAIMMVMLLHDYVCKSNPDDIDKFETWRDVLEKYADYEGIE